MTDTTNLRPHEQRVVTEKAELDSRIEKLHAFIADSPVYKALAEEDRILLLNQEGAMTVLSRILGQRIARFQPVATDPADFPLGKACDLSGEGNCEACQ